MARLLNPSVGETLDRLSILDLKIAAAQSKKIDAHHFWVEREELVIKCLEPILKKAEAFDVYEYEKLKRSLATVNQKLWNLEDEARTLPRVSDSSTAQIIRGAQLRELTTDLNDCRADLVAKLNAFFGIHEKEKIYQCATPK